MSEQERPERDRDGAELARPAPIGPGDTPNVAGTDEQQPQLAATPSAGLEPDEPGPAERDTRSPIVAVDPPGPPGGADGDPAAREPAGHAQHRDEPS